jgi:hypothetical protein
VARWRPILHVGTLYEAPELPPEARELKFDNLIATAFWSGLFGGAATRILWMMARRGLAPAA